MASPDKKKVQITVNEMSNDGASGSSTKAVANDRSRDVTRGLWELARFHTREAWLCWYPAGLYLLAFRIPNRDSTYNAQSGERV